MRPILLALPFLAFAFACDRRATHETQATVSAAPAAPLMTPIVSPETPMAASKDPASDPATMTDAQWRAKLSPEQYRVLREKGTERAFTGAYWDTKTAGEYRCAGCGALLFMSDSKFDSECGWPSFDKAAGSITETRDTSFGSVRTEITCSRCNGHIGHVFSDGPTKTGRRYCVNSVSVALAEKTKDVKAADAKSVPPPK